MKKCAKCGLSEPIVEFYAGASKCKSCKKQYEKEYAKQNKDKVFLAKQQYRETHAEQLSLSKKKWRSENKEQVAAVLADWYSKNTDKKKQYEEEYVRRNKQKVLAYRSEYKRNRQQSDPLFALMIRIRRLIGVSLKRRTFSKKAEPILIWGVLFKNCRFIYRKLFLGTMDDCHWIAKNCT
jgi:hypothetical protein